MNQFIQKIFVIKTFNLLLHPFRVEQIIKNKEKSAVKVLSFYIKNINEKGIIRSYNLTYIAFDERKHFTESHFAYFPLFKFEVSTIKSLEELFELYNKEYNIDLDRARSDDFIEFNLVTDKQKQFETAAILILVDKKYSIGEFIERYKFDIKKKQDFEKNIRDTFENQQNQKALSALKGIKLITEDLRKEKWLNPESAKYKYDEQMKMTGPEKYALYNSSPVYSIVVDFLNKVYNYIISNLINKDNPEFKKRAFKDWNLYLYGLTDSGKSTLFEILSRYMRIYNWTDSERYQTWYENDFYHLLLYMEATFKFIGKDDLNKLAEGSKMRIPVKNRTCDKTDHVPVCIVSNNPLKFWIRKRFTQYAEDDLEELMRELTKKRYRCVKVPVDKPLYILQDLIEPYDGEVINDYKFEMNMQDNIHFEGDAVNYSKYKIQDITNSFSTYKDVEIATLIEFTLIKSKYPVEYDIVKQDISAYGKKWRDIDIDDQQFRYVVDKLISDNFITKCQKNCIKWIGV